MGWALLGLENAGAAGAQIPAEVKTRLALDAYETIEQQWQLGLSR
jgi:hypothetical protein